MAFKALTENIEKATHKTEDYFLNTAEYYKLRVFKSTAKGAISLVNILIVGVILLLILLFISIGAALWLGDILDSRYLGYFIVAGFYIVLLIVLNTLLKEKIKTFILLRFSDIFFENEQKPRPDFEDLPSVNDPEINLNRDL